VGFVLKARILWHAVLMVVAILSISPATSRASTAFRGWLQCGTHPRPSENHVYTITLQNGTAIIEEANQHGVDVVIDVL
jgi:hypothetical protein